MVHIVKNFLIMLNNLPALKNTSKREIEKKAEATAHLIGNKIADRITKVSKKSQQNNSETVEYEHDQKYLKKDMISRRKTETY